MIIESIKKLLGEELATKVEEALKGKGEGGKDVDLVSGNDGSYIPKAKFDDVNEKYKTAEQLASTTQKTLEGIKAAGDPAQLKADLEAAQKAAKVDAEKHKADMAEKDLNFAIQTAITDAHDPAMVAGLIDKAKLKMLDDGKVVGLEDALKTIRTEKPFLFKPADGQQQQQNQQQLDGAKPAQSGAQQPNNQQPTSLAEAVRLQLESQK